MFTRHSIAAAALLVTTFSAQADVVSVANASTLTANSNIVDSASSLNGGSLAALLAASNSTSELYLVRGVEGLYMVASRTISVAADAQADVVAIPVSTPAPALTPALAELAADVTPTTNADAVAADTPILIGTTQPAAADAAPIVSADAGQIVNADADPIVNVDADPIVNAAEVPEPSSIALLLAGVLGAAGFTRARKQG
jgi:hypothetical protein